MEIDITDFIMREEPAEYSASAMELGPDAGRITWANAGRQGAAQPMLTTEEQLDAFRDHAREYGAWSDDEIAAWSDAECNGLFVQMVSGDMREAGMDDAFPDEFDWSEYQANVEAGRCPGRIYRGDIEGSDGFGRVFYYLGT